MNALCLVLEGENIALPTIVKDYRERIDRTAGRPDRNPGNFRGNFSDRR